MAEGGHSSTLRAASKKAKGGAKSKSMRDTSTKTGVPESRDDPGDGAPTTFNCHSNLEIEYMESEPESETHWKRCTKNPGHNTFIPASEFSLQNLPEPYRNNLYFKGIRALSQLTVRVRVKYTSKNRPDDYPSAKYRGRKVPRSGTGFLDEFMFYERFFDLEHRDYIYPKDAVLDQGRYVSVGVPNDVDRSKKVPTDLSPEECLSQIKTLRGELGLSDVDVEDFYDKNKDEIDDEEEEEAVLGGFINKIGKKVPSCSTADRGRYSGAFMIPHGDKCDDDDDDDDDDNDDYDDYFDAVLGIGNDDDDDDDDEWSGRKKYKLIKTDKQDMQKQHESSIPPNLDVKFRYDPDEDILNQTFRPVNPCPCPECVKSGHPEPHGFYVNVWTARHVVFDSDEAKQTEVDLFYDKEVKDDGIKHKTMYGIQTHSHSHKGDWAVLMCVTHDLALVLKLRIIMKPMLQRIERMRKKATTPLAVICSHPHGYVKQISIGDWTDRYLYPTRDEGIEPPPVARSIPRSVGSSYLYKAPTCPGSSGAAVLILGHRQETQLLESPFHPHHGSHDKTLNKSGIAHSTFRKLEELPAALLCNVLSKYEEMGEEESQQKSLNEEARTDRAIRAEKLQKYLAILKQKDKDNKEREEILKNVEQRKKEIEERKKKMRELIGGGFESIEDFINSE